MHKISIITASKEKDTPQLRRLKASLDKQTYKNWEHIVVTEGTPESAKSIGLRSASGEIIGIVASDCEFPSNASLQEVSSTMNLCKWITGCFSAYYAYDKKDPILNRYFSLFGCNDPVPLYLGKNDRLPWYRTVLEWKLEYKDRIPTLGDNGFFVWKHLITKADIYNYFHIDVCEDLRQKGYYSYARLLSSIKHNTGNSLMKWIYRRFYYADTLSKDRRWHMIEKRDLPKLIWFIICSITFIEPTLRAIYGFIKSEKDIAWFLHPLVCFVSVITYGVYTIKRIFKR